MIADSPKIKRRRRSTMSASAPAGIANRNIGRLLATCTMETMNGSGLRLVMSQPEATLYIQPPMFETTVAVQITANVRLRNGAHAVAAVRGGEAAGGSFVCGALIHLVQDEGDTHANSNEGLSRVVSGDEGRPCRPGKSEAL